MQFQNVSVLAKANVYFDGKVVSHSVVFADGTKKTLGVIYPGSYHFATQAAERMEIIDGVCTVTRDGIKGTTVYGAGTYFEVPANSGFTISVATGMAQYVCTFLS